MENELLKDLEYCKKLEDFRLMAGTFLTAIKDAKPNPIHNTNTTVKALHQLTVKQAEVLKEIVKNSGQLKIW